MSVIKNILISCEHGGNQIPMRYRTFFDEQGIEKNDIWNRSTLDLALSLSEKLDVPCFTHQTSRLLVDVNLSLGNESLFYLDTSLLGDAERQSILERYYFPYRLRVENTITMSEKAVLHLSIHTSFVQAADVVIVFNSERLVEKECVVVLTEALKSSSYPLPFALHDISGMDDAGFVQYLRTRFDEESYAGFTLIVHPRLIEGENIVAFTNQLSQALSFLRS
ncbi:MAG: hypothetical protein EBU52_06955 [Cytophagia bacterium]|nr:hypothetical protein [Cytophagia bacterium]